MRVQILNETICISPSINNTLEKGMNPIILLPAMGKIVGQTGCLGLVRPPVNRLPIKWKSDLSHKIKRNFFQAVVVSILL